MPILHRNRRHPEAAERPQGSLASIAVLAVLAACAQGKASISSQHPQCDQDNGQLTLPTGFCAAIFADAIGVARHLVIGRDGTVYVALESGARTSASTSRQHESGAIVVLRDTDGDGRADLVRRIST